jgi:uncharacterized protein (DUF433 family)
MYPGDSENGVVSTKLSDDELIERYIEPNPHGRGRANARVIPSWVPVWALIGNLPASNYDPRDLADAYKISVEEVEAALAFYRRYAWLIDARLEMNAGTRDEDDAGAETESDEDRRIAEYIDADPHGYGVAEARLRQGGVSVWALVGHLPGVDYNLKQLAKEFAVADEAVEVAMAFYWRHRSLIDARIAMNRGV